MQWTSRARDLPTSKLTDASLRPSAELEAYLQAQLPPRGTALPASVLDMVHRGLSHQGSLERERRERRFEAAMAAYNAGEVTTTEALIRAGLSGRAAKLAYRFPRLFGHLCPLSAADRLRPIYAPEEGWRTVYHSPPSLPFEPDDLGNRFGSGPDWPSEEDFPGH